MLWRIDWLGGTILWIPIEGYKRRKPKRYLDTHSANKAMNNMIGIDEYHGPHDLANYVDAPGHKAHGIFKASDFYLGAYNS